MRGQSPAAPQQCAACQAAGSDAGRDSGERLCYAAENGTLRETSKELSAVPSPFPGMEPYLERPALWPGVHFDLIGAVRDALQPLVRPRNYVSVELRTYSVGSEEFPLLGIPDAAGIGEHAPGPRQTDRWDRTAGSSTDRGRRSELPRAS